MSRVKFATEHVIWTEEQRDCFRFSDESKFNLFGCDRRRFIRRSPKEGYSPQCSKSIIKFGEGSMMVLGMISTACTGPLVRLHVKINATVYKEILKKHVLNLRTAINKPAISMQGNTLCHTAKSVKTFLSEKDVSYGVPCSKPRHESN